MSKHRYDKLFVSCLEPRYFDPRDPSSLRAAVEHLRTVPDTQFVQLTVEAPVHAGPYKLRAPAAIKLHDIKGKTPAEIWAYFDKKVDDQIAYFARGAEAAHPL
jgi:hypothetical protein